MYQCASQAWLRLCVSAAHLYYHTNLCVPLPVQYRQVQLCFTSTFKQHFSPSESGFLGKSMLRQKILWAVPSTPQVEGKFSAQKAKAGCSQHECPWKCAVTRQQTPVDAADRQIASCPCTTELHPLTQQLDMGYHRDSPEMPCDGERVMCSCPTSFKLSC